MSKLTMETYSREMMILSKWPRRDRDRCVKQLTEQAAVEDAAKNGKVNERVLAHMAAGSAAQGETA